MSKVAYTPNIWGGPLPDSNATIHSTASSSPSGNDYIELQASQIYLTGTIIGPVEISGNLIQTGGFTYLGLNNNQNYPNAVGAGAAVGWNFTGGNGEVDFWNVFPQPSGTNDGASFIFKQMTGTGTADTVAAIYQKGRISCNQLTMGGFSGQANQIELIETGLASSSCPSQMRMSRTEANTQTDETQFIINHHKTGGSGNVAAIDLQIDSTVGDANFFIGMNALCWGKKDGAAYHADFFGSIFTAQVDAALPLCTATGIEVDIIAGGDVATKIGVAVVDEGTSVGAGATYDAGIMVGKQGGGRGFNYGLQFGFALAGAAGEINNAFLYCPSGTIPYAVDFSGVTFSTAAWKGAFTATGNISTNGGSIGYATGAGGSVTQLTNKSTAVTINKVCGQIITDSATLNANTSVAFTVNNTQHGADDVVVLSIKGEATPGSYLVQTCAIATNSFAIHIRNITAGNLSEALSINFAIIKCVVS